MRSQITWLLISWMCLNDEDADVKREGKYLCVAEMAERFSSLKTMDLRFSMIPSQRQKNNNHIEHKAVFSLVLTCSHISIELLSSWPGCGFAAVALFGQQVAVKVHYPDVQQ